MAVALLGVGVLGVSCRLGFRPLSWNDEIVYAVAGRNVAEGKGPLSNFYHPNAILARGFPLRDVHMPGHIYAVGLALAAAGPREWAARLPGQVSFVAAGLMLLALGWWLYDLRAGYAAALLFFLFPSLGAFANSAMAEATLLPPSVAFVGLWVMARERPRLVHSVLLALCLVLGSLHRESFLAFLPPALYALYRWPSPERRRAAAAFTAPFVLGLAVLFWPLYRARAPYPHVLSDALDASADRGRLVELVLGNLRHNVDVLSAFPAGAWSWVRVAELVLLVAAAVWSWRGRGVSRSLARLALVTGAINLLALVTLNPLTESNAARLFFFTLPPIFLVAGAALSTFAAAGGAAVRTASVVVPLAVSFVLTERWIGGERQALDAFGRRYALFLREHLAGASPQVVVAPKGYRFGWEAYPVSVIVWDAVDLKLVRRLDQAVTLDAIVVRKEERRRFRHGLAEGAYRHRYCQANAEPLDGRYDLFLRADSGGGCVEPPLLTAPSSTPPPR